ncbi:MAG TPA: hypothetical protein PKY86_07985 [Niabella sp.]|nr:hypothetical protein [Niabella sp.]HQW14174.1 hypothetical protein [Niabella sp.]HQX19574.1 hypothetical protein [Niabella sp.]HQX39992.1 hypothetical protein [Niabella sp.]HRB06986.1 hypothetical protein [Niabella sp.]
MTCEFQTLYAGPDGYIVRCNLCGHYQVAYISTLINLNENDFHLFYKKVKAQNRIDYSAVSQDSKIIMLATPSPNINFILTPSELITLHDILEKADTEIKTHALLGLFR